MHFLNEFLCAKNYGNFGRDLNSLNLLCIGNSYKVFNFLSCCCSIVDGYEIHAKLIQMDFCSLVLFSVGDNARVPCHEKVAVLITNP